MSPITLTLLTNDLLSLPENDVDNWEMYLANETMVWRAAVEIPTTGVEVEVRIDEAGETYLCLVEPGGGFHAAYILRGADVSSSSGIDR